MLRWLREDLNPAAQIAKSVGLPGLPHLSLAETDVRGDVASFVADPIFGSHTYISPAIRHDERTARGFIILSMVTSLVRIGGTYCLLLALACGDDVAGTGGDSSSTGSDPSSSGAPVPTPVSASVTSSTPDGTGSSGGSGSSSAGVVDDTGTDTSTSTGADTSTGGVCEEGCPEDQHCEVGECVWDEGATIWTETFGTMIPGGLDRANAVAVDSQDEIVVVGQLATADAMGVLIPDAFDVVVRKYDRDGGLLWSQVRPQGLGVDVTTTASDEALVCIASFGPGTESAALYSATGDPQWGLANPGLIADGIEEAPDDSFFLVGWVPGEIPWAARYTPMGAVLWQADHTGEVGRQRRVMLAPDGLSLGLVGSNAAAPVEEWLQTWPVDPGTGNPGPAPTVDQHSVSAMDIAAAYANGIAYMNNGDIVVVGNELTPTESWNITLARYSPDGSTQWRESYDSPASAGDGGFDIATDSEQNIIIVGAVERTDLDEGPNAWVSKYDGSGAVLWSREHDEASLGDGANGVAVDSEDNIVVVGSIDRGDGSGTDLWIRKYAP